MTEIIFVFMIIILTVYIGYRLKSLSISGSIAAGLTGFTVFLGFGLNGLVLIGVFFATSSFWSKFKGTAKKDIEEKLEKGAVRDWRQVAANGGAASIISIFYFLFQDITLLIGFAVSLASSNSDTWASEIGSLSKRKPIYIRTFKRIDKGTSGAMSLLGTLAALCGSLLIALISSWLFQLNIMLMLIIFLFGFIGNIIDTLFGAYFQQVFMCRQCGLETEKRVHCQVFTKRIKGFPLVDNDMVNFLSGLIAAILSIVISIIVTKLL